MNGDEVLGELQPPAALNGAKLPIALFRVKEEALVELPHIGQCLRSEEQDGADEEDAARRECTAQLQGVNPGFSWRRDRPDDLLRRPVRVDQPRRNGGRAWVFAQKSDEGPG
jgi:hypothetical protein